MSENVLKLTYDIERLKDRLEFHSRQHTLEEAYMYFPDLDEDDDDVVEDVQTYHEEEHEPMTSSFPPQPKATALAPTEELEEEPRDINMEQMEMQSFLKTKGKVYDVSPIKRETLQQIMTH
jgi:hypothetical protein